MRIPNFPTDRWYPHPPGSDKSRSGSPSTAEISGDIPWLAGYRMGYDISVVVLTRSLIP